MQDIDQQRHLLAVGLGKAGMQQYSLFLRQMIPLAGQMGFARFQLGHLGLHRGMIHPIGNSVDDLRNLPFDLGKLLADAAMVVLAAGGHSVEFFVRGADEFGDEIRVQQLIAQPGQNAVFQLLTPNGQPVVAGAFVAHGGAAVIGFTQQNHAAAATATYQLAGKQMHRAFGAPDMTDAIADGIVPGQPLPCFDGMPQRIIDNAQGRHLFGHPIRLGVHPRHPLARHRVFQEPLTVPDEATNIKLVVQYPGAALMVAVDGG